MYWSTSSPSSNAVLLQKAKETDWSGGPAQAGAGPHFSTSITCVR